MLGVLLFFDGALLALGNVRLSSFLQPTTLGLTQRIRISGRVETDSIPVWSNTHHRHTKDVLLLRPETENPRDIVFPWRHPARILEMAVHWVRRGDIWVLELVRVCRECSVLIFGTLTDLPYSDFFPVILTFLRQLPFVGTILTLPYIRDVRGVFPSLSLTVQPADIPLFVNKVADRLAGSRQSVV